VKRRTAGSSSGRPGRVGSENPVIRGAEEARLIYLGGEQPGSAGGGALFDLGGGSVEVVLADAQECYFTASLKLGVIRITEDVR